MDIEHIKSGFADIKKGFRSLESGPLDYYLDTLVECHDEFFKRCSPFRVGDIVNLRKIPSSGGWHGIKHMFKIGVKGRVTDIRFKDTKFWIQVKLFNQTFIDMNGDTIPIQEKDGYAFSLDETYWSKVRVG